MPAYMRECLHNTILRSMCVRFASHVLDKTIFMGVSQHKSACGQGGSVMPNEKWLRPRGGVLGKSSEPPPWYKHHRATDVHVYERNNQSLGDINNLRKGTPE